MRTMLRHYQLIVVQQPVRARMCGFGEKDRRPVDPPPVVKLAVFDQNNRDDEEYVAVGMLAAPRSLTRCFAGWSARPFSLSM